MDLWCFLFFVWVVFVLFVFLLLVWLFCVGVWSCTVTAQWIMYRSFFLPEPVAFRRVYGLEAYSRTSRESNHHRQSVSAVKNDALPTEPRGHLACTC